MNKQNIEKIFVIKKYVKAYSAIDAIKKEKDVVVDDVWVKDKDDENKIAGNVIGFCLDQ